MKYRVTCKNLGLVGQIRPAQAGDVLDASAFPPDEIPKLMDMGAIAVVTVDEVGAATAAAEEPTPKPLHEFTRPELNELAANLGVEDAEKLPNKAAVVEAIKEAEELARTPEEIEE